MSSSDSYELTPPYFRLLVRVIRPFPNFDFWFVKSLRRRAVGFLQLEPGDRVLDAGCGPGGSFPYLVDAVGPTGKVIGVEISPEVVINARRRIAARGWANVDVIVGNAETVALQGKFQGMIFFGAPDCYGSAQALDNLLPHLAEDGRVVIFGAKLSQNPFVRMLNSLLAKAFSRATFASTPALEYEPWTLLGAGLASSMRKSISLVFSSLLGDRFLWTTVGLSVRHRFCGKLRPSRL